MKNLAPIATTILFLIIAFVSCEENEIEANFEDTEQMTIYDYIVDNDSAYSSFLQILEIGGIDKTLSAYNPDGIGYTLFLPDNKAIDQFIEESDQFTSLRDLLDNKEYAGAFSRYHVVSLGIHSNDFPFGAFTEYTLSNDFLTVSFVIETDTSYYKINNQAAVIRPNIELSNGFIHIIKNSLKPITYTTYNWLELNDGYSIFKDAVDITGLNDVLDLNIKAQGEERSAFTLLLEHDTVFNKDDIYALDDLIEKISPNNTDYTNPENPLNGFVSYHMLKESRFLDDFVDENTNYSTYSEIPLNINGVGLDILINKGKEVFDTIIQEMDTTFIDHIGFNYDASNVLTQSGAVHFIDRVMKQHAPSRANQTFEFYEEPLFNEFREELGEFIIDDPTALQHIQYNGTDLVFVQENAEESPAWGGHYLYLNGDFVITYEIPEIVQGKYNVILRAEAFSKDNALIEVFIDNKNIGGLIDLSSGGNASNPFANIELGSIDFLQYEPHTVEIRSLIPGLFLWDFIRFEPF